MPDPKTILLVEDETRIALSEKILLEKEGYRVLLAANGESAIEIICVKNEPVDLILMDIHLGSGMDGIQAAQSIFRTRDIPIIFLSSHSEKDGLMGKLAVLANDMTERRQAAEELRESAERLHQIVDQMPYPVEICDPQGTAKMVNRAFLKLFGIPSADLVVDQFNVFKDPLVMDILGYAQDIRRVYAGESVFIPEMIFPLRQVSPQYKIERTENIVFESTLFPVFQASGEIWRVVTIWKDITERKRVEDALRASEAQYKRIIETAEEGIWTVDVTGKTDFINTRGATMIGYSVDEILGHMLADFVFPEEAQLAQAELEKNQHGQQNSQIYRMKHKNGSAVWVQANTMPLNDRDGRNIGALSMFTDITERRRTENALNESEQRFRLIFEGAPDAIFLADPETGTILDANEAACRLLGKSLAEIVGMNQSQLHPPRVEDFSKESFQQHIQESQNQQSSHPIENAVLRSDGAQVPVEVKAQIIQLHDHKVLMGTFRDITERKRAEEELQKTNAILQVQLEKIQGLQETLRNEAIRDSLTGLYNRRYLFDTLDRELARAKREKYSVSVMMIDIDHFKDINDTYGHLAGDEILRTLGGLLRSEIRHSDIACRYGGEEFVVIMPGAEDGDTKRRAEMICHAFNHLQVVYGGEKINASISLGIAFYPQHGRDVNEIIKAADNAMYEAKRAGRNRVFIWQSRP